MTNMMQGDSYYIAIGDDGVDFTRVTKIEFTIGPYAKMWIANDNTSVVTYDSTNKEFHFPLTQQETFFMRGEQEGYARMFFTGGDVEGQSIGSIEVEYNPSRTVLT